MKIRKPDDSKTNGSASAVDSLKAVGLKTPSRCVDYQHQDEFSIRPPRVSEVEFLAEMNDENYDEMVTKILRALIVSPTIDPWDLTTGDRAFLHLWIRAQIDDVYRFDATCPKCGKTNKAYHLPIKSIPLREVPKEYTKGMQLELPRSKTKVKLRLETGKDRRRAVELVAKGITNWVARKALVVVAVDGKQHPDVDVCEWLRSLPAGDDIFIGEFLRWVDHGPEFQNCKMRCRECDEESLMRLPFRLEFFIPTVRFEAALGDAIRGGCDVESGDMPGDAGDQADGVRGVHVRKGKARRAPAENQRAGR